MFDYTFNKIYALQASFLQNSFTLDLRLAIFLFYLKFLF